MRYNQLTTEDFIKRAKEKFGNRFVYDKTKYVNRNTKVIIKCNQHGYFKVIPNTFLSKGCTQGGCKECRNKYLSNKFRLNIDELILSFNKKHKNKYDYSKSIYINSQTPMIIICPIHGEFKQTSTCHLKGDCKKCSDIKNRNKRLLFNKKSFIKKSKEIWGDKFDYSFFEYYGLNKKSIFICKKHKNIIQQLASNHLRKQISCKDCESDFFKKKFIEKSYKKYGKKYKYNLVNYINYKTEIKIMCPIHGEFLTTPDVHLKSKEKHQCPDCLQNEKQKKIIKKFIKIHGNVYDYSYMYFLRTDLKVKIRCEKHGFFYMAPDNHRAGKGCAKCVKYNPKFVKNKNAYLYFLKLNLDGDVAIKFGKTHYLKKRLHNIQRKFKGYIEPMLIFKSKDKNIHIAESDIKKLFKEEKNYIDKKNMKDGFTETINFTTNNFYKLLNYCENNIYLKKENIKVLV